MTFADIVATLSRDFGTNIETDGDNCAVRAEGSNKSSVTVLMQGFDEREALLMTADLGLPPPERPELLYRSLLEANDLFRDTGGATISIDSATGHVRLQRFDPYIAVSEAGPRQTLLAFATVATAWSGIVHDFRDAPKEAATEPPAQNLDDLSGLRV